MRYSFAEAASERSRHILLKTKAGQKCSFRRYYCSPRPDWGHAFGLFSSPTFVGGLANFYSPDASGKYFDTHPLEIDVPQNPAYLAQKVAMFPRLNLSAAFIPHFDNHLSLGMFFFNIPESLNNFLQWIKLIDDREDLSGFQKLPQVNQILLIYFR